MLLQILTGWGMKFLEQLPLSLPTSPYTVHCVLGGTLTHTQATLILGVGLCGSGLSDPTQPPPTQPLLSLDNSVRTRFSEPGDVRVTVQAACGSSVLQDSKVVRVLGESPPQFSHLWASWAP